MIRKRSITSLSVFFAISMSFSHVQSFAILRRFNPMRHGQLPPHTVRLIYQIEPAFRSLGIVTKKETLKSFIERIRPGDKFDAQLILKFMQEVEKGSRPDAAQLIEKVHELYYRLFIDYIITKKMPSRSMSNIMHTTDAVSSFSIKGKPHIQQTTRKHLTNLILSVFSLNKGFKISQFFESQKNRKRYLFSILTDFNREMAQLLNPLAESGSVEAQALLKQLRNFRMEMQDHALESSAIGLLKKHRKIVVASLLLLTGGIIYSRHRSKLPHHRLADYAKEIKEAVHRTEKRIANVTDLTSSVLEETQRKVERSDSINIVDAFTRAFAQELGANEGLQRAIIKLQASHARHKTAQGIALRRLEHELLTEPTSLTSGPQEVTNWVKNMYASSANQIVGLFDGIRAQYPYVKELGFSGTAKNIYGKLKEGTTPTPDEIETAHRELLREIVRHHWASIKASNTHRRLKQAEAAGAPSIARINELVERVATQTKPTPADFRAAQTVLDQLEAKLQEQAGQN